MQWRRKNGCAKPSRNCLRNCHFAYWDLPYYQKNRPPWKFSDCPKINQNARNIRISKLTFEYSKIFEYQTWYSNVCEYSNIKINIRIFAIIRISNWHSNARNRMFANIWISKLTFEYSQLFEYQNWHSNGRNRIRIFAIIPIFEC